MSAIFKVRKTPRHLVIRTNPEPGQHRFTLLWLLLGLTLLLLLTAALLYLRQG